MPFLPSIVDSFHVNVSVHVTNCTIRSQFQRLFISVVADEISKHVKRMNHYCTQEFLNFLCYKVGLVTIKIILIVNFLKIND